MPKITKNLAACKHPNSRKAKALAKQVKRSSNREKQKLGQHIKLNVLGEKVLWFRDNLLPDINSYNAKQTEDLINKYILRYGEELDMIKLKHSVGGHRKRQHASRQDIIELTIKQEKEEFDTCGIEIPDIMNTSNLSVIRNWNGELRFLQNIKFVRVSKRVLKTKMKTDV